MEPSIPEMRIEYADTQLQSVNRGSLELAGSVGGYDCWDPFRYDYSGEGRHDCLFGREQQVKTDSYNSSYGCPESTPGRLSEQPDMQYSADTVHGTVQFGRGRWGSGTSDDTCSLTQVAEQALFNVGLDPSTMAAHSAALDFFPEIYAAKDFQWENLAWQEYHRQHSALDLETAAEYDAAQLSKTPDSLIDPKLSEILSGSHASSACVDIQIDHPSAYTSHAGVAGPKSQPSPTISPEFLSVLHPYGQAQRGAHNLDDIEHSNSHHFPTDVFLPHGHASDLDVDGALSATTAPHMADMQPFVDFSNNSLGSPPLPEGDLLPTPEPSSPSSYASSASSFSPSNSWSRSPPTVSPPLRQRDSGRLKGKMTIIQPDEDEQAQKNALLLHYRNLGFSYKAIKSTLNLDDAESTLRGRYRTLTKPKSERLRRPTWSSRDIQLLLEIVDPSNTQIKWKKVSDTIVTRGGSYQFGSSTCKKKYQDLVADGRADPLSEPGGSIQKPKKIPNSSRSRARNRCAG